MPHLSERLSIAAPTVRRGLYLFAWLLLAAIACQSIISGMHIRQWAWDQSQPWRFEGDIRNAYSKGQLAADPHNGYLNLYTRFRQQLRPGSSFNLDYPPLRLLIVSRWYAWTRQHFPKVHDWQGTYAFNAPLLQLNIGFALAGFAGMWLLVGLWTWRWAAPGRYRLLIATAAGLVAGELFWFNPALIWDAHVWPQWDIWPLPFYIFAIFAASVEWWWSAGLLLAIGGLLKGQMLLVAPVMILWPMFAGKPWSTFRISVGLAFGLLGFAAPWLLRTSNEQVWQLNSFSLLWICSAVLAAALIHPRFSYVRQRLALRGACTITAASLLAWPFIYTDGPANWWALTSIAALYALVACLPPRFTPRWGFWLATAAVAALAACPWFGGSMDWWTVGFERGTVQYMFMHAGNTLNLAAILNRFGWRSPMEDAWRFHGQMLSLRTVLICVYCTGLLACSIGAAIHSRRRDSRVLISLVTPWILMYATLAQMHDRYLVFAAGLTAVAVAVGVGLTLVHLFITAIALASVVMSVNGANPPWLQHALGATYPDAAWLTLMCAAIFLWIAIAPHRRRRADIAPSNS